MDKECMLCGKEFQTSFYLPSGKRIRCDKRTKCWDCLPRYRANVVRGASDEKCVIGERIICAKCGTRFLYQGLYEGNKYCPDCADEKSQKKCVLCNDLYYVRVKQINADIFDLCSTCINKNRTMLMKKKCLAYVDEQCGKSCPINEAIIFGTQDKEFEISKMYAKSWSTLKAYLDVHIAKCSKTH